ncbi:MAG: serine/threonine-protein kinase [Gemmatimonadales bacterium]|jgi:serine/threonine-protein kinase
MAAVTGLGALIGVVYFAQFMDSVRPFWLLGSVLAVALSGGLLLVARNEKVAHATVLRLGLAHEVAVCLILATLSPWFVHARTGSLPYVTWVTPLIILFPLIVPSPPHMTLTTAIAAAATRPIGLALLAWIGDLEVPTAMYVLSSASPAFAVVLAYAGSRVVHGMAVHLVEARRMGSYHLESLLGKGGIGEVWRARHQLLARPAAVKLIRKDRLGVDEATQRLALARFEREAQATATMRSPHTIELYDFGITQGGTFYYVMELLSGLDLEVLVQRFGPMPPARAIYLLRQVCDSLGEAHEYGLIHRDIKPANVYVCRYGRQVDFVKVLDFGLVKAQGENSMSNAHTVRGTPAFMAPEQVSGRELDARTDVYALGCLAFWLVTGSLVFVGSSVTSIMIRHADATPPAPSARAEQPIPAALDRVILSCLAKDPADRPPTVDDLAAMLEAPDVGVPWTQERARRWWERHLPDH